MHHPTDRIAHITAFVTPVVVHWLEREIAQWVHTMKDRSDDPSHHERTLLPRSYISLQNLKNFLFHYQMTLYGNPLSYFSFQSVFHEWFNKGRGRCNPFCGMAHIKEPLLLIGKSSQCGGRGFPLTICVVFYHMSDVI